MIVFPFRPPGEDNQNRCRRFGLFLTAGFPIIALSSAIEPLRAANQLAERELYQWSLMSEMGQPVTSSSNIQVNADGALGTEVDLDVLFIVGGERCWLDDPNRLFSQVRRLARGGAKLGAISGGVFPLAESGLLDGHRCSVHWYFTSAFQERFPDVLATNKLYEIDRNRFTCSGGTATLDLMLTILSDELGRTTSNEISSWFQHNRIRDTDDEQTRSAEGPLSVNSGAITKAISLFRQNIEVPLPISIVADHTGLTVRQLERLFMAHLVTSPSSYYRKIRLKRAREFLLYTNMSISEIAVATGFSTQGHFAWSYRRLYGRTPTDDQREIRRGAPAVQRTTVECP